MIEASPSYTLVIGTGADSKSYPVRRSGFTLQLKAGASGKHSSSACQLSVRGTAILPDIMMKTGLIDAKVVDNEGNTLFTGVVRPYASVTAEPMYLGDLNLEVLDYTEKMHKKVYAEIEEDDGEEPSYGADVIFEDRWNGMKVCDPDHPASSIVHKLCSLCGISDIDAPLIDVTLARFRLEKGDYIDEVLGSLLYEYIHDFRFDALGKMHVFQTGTVIDVFFDDAGKVIKDQTVYHKLEKKQTVTVFRNQLSIARSDAKNDGCLVTYKKYKKVYNVKIGTYTVQGNAGLVSGQISLSPQSYQLKWDLSEIKDDDSGLDVELSNFSVDGYNDSVWTATCGSYETYLTGCDQEKGTLNFRIWYFGGLFGQWRYTMDVYADATYYKQDSRTVGYAGDNAEEYSADYIDDIEHALCLATAIQERNVFGTFSYTFESFEDIEPGTIIGIDEKTISGASSTVRVTKKTIQDDTGLIRYEAEGYGESEFRLPEINRDDDAEGDQDIIGSILLTVSEDTVFPGSSEPTIYAEASGLLFSRYGVTPSWSLNGTPMVGLTGQSIQFSITMLAPGANRLRVQGEYNGETYYADRIINCISTDIDIQMQFALVPSGQSPDSSTVWLDSQPVPGQGEVVWMRFRTSTSGEWIVMKMTAEDGGNPVVFFQWAATPYIRPDDAFELLTWDDMAITWETDGEVMGFILDSGRWETMVPEKPFGLNYLWVKYWNYQTDQWDYFCTTGTPAMSFDLIVNPQTFKLTTRGVVKEDTEQTDGCQRIIVRCQRYNTTAPISWAVEPEDEEFLKWERTVDTDDSEIRIILNPMVRLESVSVHCSIADIDVAKDFLITGVQEGKAETMYLGIIQNGATFPGDTTEGQLMIGDHVLVEQADGSRVPYYYTGQAGDDAWVMADASTPSEHAWKIMQDTIYDALDVPTVSQSESVINLYAANFAAINAFIQNLCAQILRIDGAIYGGDYKANGDWIGSESTDPQQQVGGQGFHINSRGLLQATFAKLRNVEISSVDGGGRTVLKTYQSTDTDSFDYAFHVEPTCFRLSDAERDYVWLNGELLHSVEIKQVPVLSGDVIPFEKGSTKRWNGGARHFTMPQNCIMAVVLNGTISTSQDDGSAVCTITADLNGERVNSLSYTCNPSASVSDSVILPFTEVQQGDDLMLYMSGNNCHGTIFYNFYVKVTSELENVFAPVASPDRAWYTSGDWNNWGLDIVHALSSGEYINVGSAPVTNVEIQYAENDTGIITGLSSKVKEGNRYLAASGSTLKWNGITKSVTEVYKTGSSYAFVLSDDSVVYISDPHTACNLELHVASQPSYVDMYRLTVSDPNGMIGTSSQPVPNIYANYFRGRLTMQSFAPYGANASPTRPNVIIASWYGSNSDIPAGAVKITDKSTGKIDIDAAMINVWSNGFAEILLYVNADDDTYSYIDVPLSFVADLNTVQASGFRKALWVGANDPAPGLGGTGKDAQFDAFFWGWQSVAGSAHEWSRITVFNDWEEIEGSLTIAGMIDQSMHADIISHDGNLSFLFDA